MRPKVFEGVEVTVPKYKKHTNFRDDLLKEVELFHNRWGLTHDYMLAMSGGVDSEATAWAFEELKIPYRVISLDLFGKNDYDLRYVLDFCDKTGKEPFYCHMDLEKLVYKLPKFVKYGQFSESLSQAVLCELLDWQKGSQITIFSGHNPDFHKHLGFGWWEDCINLVKYAINTHKNFHTFTSLESIFCHYAKNIDLGQAGNKDSNFIHQSFPQITKRPKYTGWEKLHDVNYEFSRFLNRTTWANTKERTQIFVTWR